MPEYELMYLLASSVADDEVGKVTEMVKKFIADSEGSDVRETLLGKKKLAYPIKKTRNGYYVVVNFKMDTQNVNGLEAKLRTQKNVIIRHLLINLEEHLERLEKDKIAQAKIQRRTPSPESEAKAEAKKEEKAKEPAAKKIEEAPMLDIDQEELDKKIEEALNEDLTK